MMNSKRVRRTLDRLAYASLILDICIALITALSVIGVNEPQERFLIPISYLLTIVVVLSVIMFAVLLLIRAKERQV